MRFSDLLAERTTDILVLEPGTEILVDEDELVLDTPFTLEGGVVRGTGENVMRVSGSDITFKNVRFENFYSVFVIDGFGSEIGNLRFENCIFENYSKHGILIGSSVSDSTISGIMIDHCTFKGPGLQTHKANTFGVYGVMLQVAINRGREPLENCVLENVTIRDCLCYNYNRCAFWISCATSTDLPHGLESGYYGPTSHLVCRNIRMENNTCRETWDATINVITAMANQTDTLLEGLYIRHNTLETGFWGIFLIAGEPLLDTCERITLRDVYVENNVITERRGGAGEDTYGIAVMAGRLDYFDHSGTMNCLTSDIHVSGNIIRNTTTGIIVSAADSLVEGKGCLLENCRVENVELKDNYIHNTTYAFKVFGVWLEGRAFDYQIGIPPRNNVFSPFVEDHREVTVTARDNAVKGIRIVNNRVEGYKYRYFLSGAFASGHGRIQNNQVLDLSLENNTFETGEYRINVQNMIVSGWVKDEGGNCINEELKWDM